MSKQNPNKPGVNSSGNEYTDSLIWGSSWDLNTNQGGPEGTLTYSFNTDIDIYSPSNYYYRLDPWSSFAKNQFRSIFDSIEAIIPIDFVEVNYSDPSGSNLIFSNVNPYDTNYYLGFQHWKYSTRVA